MKTEEIEKGFQEIWKLFQDTDKKFQDTDRKFQDTDKKFQDTDKKLKQTDRILGERFKQTDEEVKKTSKTVTETSKAVYALTGKWSLFVEGLIAPAAERLFKERGIIVDKVYQRVKTHRNGDEMEIDILAINGEYAVLIEAKSSLSIDDVKDHVSRLEKFKSYFPEYKERKVIGAVGGIVIEESADRYAYKQGMFVITESGESVAILNDKNFEPKVW